MEILSKPSPRLLIFTAGIGAAAAIFLKTAPKAAPQGAQLIMLILGVLLCYNLLVIKNFFTLGGVLCLLSPVNYMLIRADGFFYGQA